MNPGGQVGTVGRSRPAGSRSSSRWSQFVPAAVMSSPAGADTPSIVVSEAAPWGGGRRPTPPTGSSSRTPAQTTVEHHRLEVDDNSDSASLAVALNGVTSIAAGQSAVFIEGTAATATSFTSTWFGASPPSGFTIGYYEGSGVGLSTSGDAVNIFDTTNAPVTGITFGASDSTPPLQSFDNAAGLSGEISTLSSVGTNGAFTTTNDSNEVGSPGTSVIVAGSPTTTGVTTTTAPSNLNFQPWPGSPDVQNASTYIFNTNMSGLDYEGTGTATPGVLWGVRNGPGTLFRLNFDGTNWNPDTTDGWSNGKLLHYPDGTGDPDSEGIAMVGDTSAGGIYVSTERNNDVGNVSRLSVLRYDPAAARHVADRDERVESHRRSARPARTSASKPSRGSTTRTSRRTTSSTKLPDTRTTPRTIPTTAPGSSSSGWKAAASSTPTRSTRATAASTRSRRSRVASRRSWSCGSTVICTTSGPCATTRATVARRCCASIHTGSSVSRSRSSARRVCPTSTTKASPWRPRRTARTASNRCTGPTTAKTSASRFGSGTLPFAFIPSVPTEVPEFPLVALSIGSASVILAGWFLVRRRSLATA